MALAPMSDPLALAHTLHIQYTNLRGFGYIPVGVVLTIEDYIAIRDCELPEIVQPRLALFGLPVTIARAIPCVVCSAQEEVESELALSRIRPSTIGHLNIRRDP